MLLWSVRCGHKKGTGKRSLLHSQVLERESLHPKSGPYVSHTEQVEAKTAGGGQTPSLGVRVE